ncbi:hypothetical protein BS78_02G166900 [Paspalum vaginatum]|nr:hypothetical protein BS78_02G166900 [Paspalum vaginatum]
MMPFFYVVRALRVSQVIMKNLHVLKMKCTIVMKIFHLPKMKYTIITAITTLPKMETLGVYAQTHFHIVCTVMGLYTSAVGHGKHIIVLRTVMKIEAMMLSDPKDCKFFKGTCEMHTPQPMLQVFSLKLAKVPVNVGSVELYGYIAVRDILDPLLNYVVNFSRNDPIIVKQGSLIEMTGPKRGIELCDTTLIEYDMRIKTGREEKEDLQLIDGVSFVDDISTRTTYTFTRRIHGDSGAVDITVSRLDNAVEATIEIYISGVGSSFNLCVGCFTSGLREKIQLFNGAIVASRGLRRYVVAVVMDTCMVVKLKVGSGLSSRGDNAENCCTFKATNHGWTSQQIKVGFASILVKVTWSTLSFMSNNPLILPPVENS